MLFLIACCNAVQVNLELTGNNLTISSLNTANDYILSGQDFQLQFPYGTGDIVWSNWPKITGQGLWQWYCPDKLWSDLFI